MDRDSDIFGSFIFGGLITIFLLLFLVILPMSNLENHCDDLGTLMNKKTMVIDNKCSVDMGSNQWVPVDELSLVLKNNVH